ncbi:hypothetical protein LSCM1_05078 [Leishmania martiniquensis]|uniref:Amastin-like surface protein-like protein n=1 Tax=Leishmania martiniquensis TaxID=1580590 RepID=A0A836GPS8_9TRYP|nr:hypothetical protein LSCM1_05078 [Leishmania martiniquensis]
MALLSPFVGAVIFTAIQFTVLLLVVIATPISQIESTATKACFTFWGIKMDCSKVHYSGKGKSAFGDCGQRLNNMNGGAAFAIISIITTFTALIFGILMLLRVSCAVLFPLIFTSLSALTILISWACVAGAFTIKMCGVRWSDWGLEYGPGFGFMVAAMCLQIINVLVLVIISFF